MPKKPTSDKLDNIFSAINSIIIQPRNGTYLLFVLIFFILFNLYILDNFINTNFENNMDLKAFIFYLFVCYLYYLVLHCSQEYEIEKSQNRLRYNIYNGLDEGYNKWKLEQEKKEREDYLNYEFKHNKLIRKNWKYIIDDPIICENFFIAKKSIPIKMNWEDAMIECKKLGKDWRLPTILELKLMYLNKDEIGDFNEDSYWSDMEINGAPYHNSRVQALDFRWWSGLDNPIHKSIELYVRAVRSF